MLLQLLSYETLLLLFDADSLIDIRSCSGSSSIFAKPLLLVFMKDWFADLKLRDGLVLSSLMLFLKTTFIDDSV